MAAPNYTPISLYYSTTTTNAPTAGNLVNGELAINITDGKLFYKDNAGVVQVLATKAGANGDVVGPAAATNNAVATYDGTTGKLIKNNTGVTIASNVVTASGFSGPLNGTVGATTPTTGTFTQVDITAQGDLRLQDTTGGEYVALQAPGTLAASYTLTLPVDDGTSGQVLSTDGNGVLSWSTNAGGDVFGPASATNNAVPTYDGTTGKLIKNNTGVTIASNVVTASGFSGPLNGTVGATTPTTGTFTQVDITAQGDLRLQDTTGGEYVAIQAPGTIATSYTLTLPVDDGTAGQVLSTDGTGVLSWATNAGGDVFGPASATNNAIATYDGTTGKLIKDNSGVTIASNIITASGFSGPLNGTVGATTPTTGVFTQVDITGQGDLRLQDTTGGQYVALQAPGTIATSYTLTLPVDDGTSGQVLTTDGTGNLSWTTNLSGDVVGPASATDEALARFDLTTGKLIQNSVVTVTDAGVMSGATQLNVDNIRVDGNDISTTNTNGNLTFTANGTGYYSYSGTQAVLVPKGNNTTERPATPVTGMLRYNNTTNEFEGYSGATPAWKSVGGAAISNDTSTATDVYPAFLNATSGTASTIYTSNAKLLYKPSTGELKVDAPVANNGIFVNNTTVSSSYTIASGSNGMSVGPMTVGSGATVTVSSGQRWLIL